MGSPSVIKFEKHLAQPIFPFVLVSFLLLLHIAFLKSAYFVSELTLKKKREPYDGNPFALHNLHESLLLFSCIIFISAEQILSVY
jgi:hypothetical protein